MHLSPTTAREKPTQHGAWTGVAAGAVLGILFPPGLLIDVAVGGLAGGVIGHFWNGMSRKDVMELGERLDEGTAALLIIGKSKLDKELKNAEKEARRQAVSPLRAGVRRRRRPRGRRSRTRQP